VFKNRTLRRIEGGKREEVTAARIKVHKEEPYDMYSKYD
jgi:hypothetical protein